MAPAARLNVPLERLDAFMGALEALRSAFEADLAREVNRSPLLKHKPPPGPPAKRRRNESQEF